MKSLFIVISAKTVKRFIIGVLLLFLIIFLTYSRVQYINTFAKDNLLTNKTIVIDPGHGGIDGGTSYKNEILEKDVNLDISLKLHKELNGKNINVIMTREEDVSLENRSNLKSSRYRRDLHARKSIINESNGDLFLSIHANSNPRKIETKGVIIFYYKGSDKSKELALKICESIDHILYKNIAGYEEVKTEVLPNDYYILRETNIPGVLIEVGFMTNVDDRKLLKNEKYQRRIAKAISKGVEEYVIQ